MAKMSDLAPDGRLHCGSENHPAHLSRDTMYFLEEKGGFYVFACRLCTEIRRQLQIHVVSKSMGAERIQKRTRKAHTIDRDSRGKILSFH